MIRLNLLSRKETERAIGRRQQLSLVALGLAVALLIMVVPFILQRRALGSLDAQVERLKRQIQQFNTQVREVRELDRLEREAQTKLRIIQDLNQKRVGPSHVLDDLSGSTPDNLWLIEFDEVKGQATFTGLALDNETIARFMRQLLESPYFFGVDLVETSRSTPQGGPVPAQQQPKGDAPSFTRFIVKASIDYFGRDGKPADAPARGAKPAVGQPAAAPAKQEPKA